MIKKWWHNSIVYQVYPSSFCDSNKDGVGDIKGIISKLEYIKNLGVDIIWISPIFKSPMDDNGYDISDYQDIDSKFGTMEDFESLINKANNLGLKIIMDLVINHSSDEHKWFIEARNKESFYRDFYIWRKSNNEFPPNDIQSVFGGSAWEFDEESKEYYLHMFSKKQPDLNWDNPYLREKIYSMMNFWINKGISGFRMDVIDLIGKDVDEKIIGNTSKTHEYLKEMNEKTFGKHDLFTVGETGGVNIERAKLFTNPNRHELHTVFHFEHVSLDQEKNKSKWDLKKLDLVEFKDVLSRWQTELSKDEWNSIYFCNHDQPRSLSRFGDDSTEEYRVLSGKMLATVLHFMRGIPYVYQGEEIGMTNGDFEDISEYKDIETINMYKDRIAHGYLHEEIMESIRCKGRDNARTPMQWNNSKNAGFTEGIPWIKVNKNYKVINVEKSLNDPNSIFYYYKKLIEFRKNNEIVVYGDYELILKDHKSIFAYLRKYNDEKILVVCNFYKEEVEFSYKHKGNIEKIISNYEQEYKSLENIKLKPYESFAYFIKS